MNRKKYNTWSGIFFGVGLVAFFDEAVFHQLLHWHHFYDKETLSVGLISDGLFHAFSWFSTVVGLFMLADIRKKKIWNVKKWVGGLFVGAGVFQLYDGTIQHKLMKIHQIRYDVEIFYYDLTWNVLAVILLIIGGFLLRQSSSVGESHVSS